jgi:hypothetical protein
MKPIGEVMALETRLRALERASMGTASQAQESITVETVLGELSIPVSVLPTIEKIYGNKSNTMIDERL